VRRCARFVIRKADNKVRPGIAAVRARLENGALLVVAGSCPNLLAEAGLYRYDPEQKDSEKPRAEHNHALDALRYLVSSIDVRFMAQARRRPLLVALFGKPSHGGRREVPTTFFISLQLSRW
jgi:hypothetical protein